MSHESAQTDRHSIAYTALAERRAVKKINNCYVSIKSMNIKCASIYPIPVEKFTATCAFSNSHLQIKKHSLKLKTSDNQVSK